MKNLFKKYLDKRYSVFRNYFDSNAYVIEHDKLFFTGKKLEQDSYFLDNISFEGTTFVETWEKGLDSYKSYFDLKNL